MRNVVACLVALVSASFALDASAQQAPRRNQGLWFDRDYSQFIFFAVLEGLYADGVTTETIDAIIPPMSQDPFWDFNHSFVYACPLCHPAYEAMHLYRGREKFMGQKAEDPKKSRDTFGPALPKELADRVQSSDEKERRAALQELIQRWVSKRIEQLRLTETERMSLALGIEEGRKEGAKHLEGQKAEGLRNGRSVPSANWMTCAICEGSFGACQKKPSPITVPPAKP